MNNAAKAVEPRDRGNVLELRAELHARGFTEYQTMAGWIPVEQFNPYGLAPPSDAAPAGVNWRPQYRGYFGAIVIDRATGAAFVEDRPAAGFVDRPYLLGRFPIRRGAAAPEPIEQPYQEEPDDEPEDPCDCLACQERRR
jgi:hypothetical protein